MAELMRLRVQRSDIDVERSSANMWMCCKIVNISRVFTNWIIMEIFDGFSYAAIAVQRWVSKGAATITAVEL